MIIFFNEKRFLFSLYIILFFHISSFASSSIDIALEKKLYESHIWKALLHIRDEEPKINDKTFLLSYKNFSLKNELIKTIESFEKAENICKYPARYLWLKEEIPTNKFKSIECPKFDYYINQTDVSDIELVFASENVTSPSSMMGHVFFKINSKQKNKNKKVKQNAVSFFTVIDTFNIPLLITKSTVTGMNGYFILNPYQKQISKYLYEENRSIWEYKLKLTSLQKKIIYYHFWELKDINMTYFFTDFNCATMIDDILSITKEDYMSKGLWVTPKDVIKNANKNNLISKRKMIPSIEWELNMLLENIDSHKVVQIMKIFKNKQYTKIKDFDFSKENNKKDLEKQFILAFSKYEFINKKTLSKNDYLYITTLLNEKSINSNIDLKDYKNPLSTVNDTQISFYYKNTDEKNYLGVSFLPASNTIFDDNREYFGENSLKIGEINLLIDSKEVHLDSLNFYHMKSLIPWNNITKEVSKEFTLSYEKHYDEKLKKINILNVSGGLGITYKPHNDIFLYALGKIGIGANFKKVYPYTSFEVGTIIYEVLNMKTVLSHEVVYNQNATNSSYQKTKVNQSLFVNKKSRFDFSFEETNKNNYRNESLMLRFNYIF